MMHVIKIRLRLINVGERRREDYGDIAGLAASLEKFGQLVPILVDEVGGGRYRLIFGGRRLEAANLLKWVYIDARVWSQLSDEEFREIEVEENEQRKSLTEGERLRSFENVKRVLERKEKTRKAIEEKIPNSRRGPKTDGPSQREIAAAMGIDPKELRNAERHVETAEAFPFMQGNVWKQSHVLAVREHLEEIPELEREKAMGVLHCAKILAPTDAVMLLGNIAKKQPNDREELYRLSQSEDPREISLALTKAAELPPRPDPRVELLNMALQSLGHASRPYPKDPLTPQIEAVIIEVRKIRAAVKEVSFDATREQKKGAVQ